MSDAAAIREDATGGEGDVRDPPAALPWRLADRVRRAWRRRAPDWLATPSRPGAVYLLVFACWLTLTGSYLGVLYHVTDVAGGVHELAVGVGVAVLAGTVVARLVPARVAVGLGVAALAVGLATYVRVVPGLAATLVAEAFLTDLWTTLTGASVLGFVRADLWALAVAPPPVFVSWYMAVRRRYAWSVVAGGLVLGFFVLSSDAGETATLVGVVGALGLLGVGGFERSGVTRDQLERLGLGLALVVLAARLLPVVPRRHAGTATAAVAGDGGGAAAGPTDGRREDPLGGLTRADERLGVRGRISLSPAVRFTVTADEPALWHVAAYDRYTGDGWVATGTAAAYPGRLPGPPGPARTLHQRFEAATDLGVMPAAWRPVAVGEAAADGTRVVESGDLRPAEPIAAGDGYEVESRVPTADEATLRRAGTEYPAAVADRFLELPGSTPARVGDLADQLAGDAGTPYDAARAVQSWLRASKGYSLDVPDPGDHAADGFLFGMDRGYCVHFATAMAVLLRTLDVPARVAAGYRPGERVEADTWVVRGLDSHAWVEVYFPGVGWMSFDPTPPGPRREAERARLAAARRGGDEDGVGGVDADGSVPGTTRTVTGGGNVAGETPGRDVSSLRSLDGGDVGAPAATTGSPSLVTRLSELDGLAGRDRVTLLAAAAGAVVGARRLRLLARGREAVWLRNQEPTADPSADVEEAFARLEALTARRHRPREDAETPRQYLDAVGTTDDPRARLVLRRLERARYAGGVTRADADEAIAAVDEMVRERRRLATAGRD